MRESREKVPGWPTPGEWVILDSANPEASAKTVAEFKAHPMSPVVVDVVYHLNAASAEIVSEYYFKCRMLGNAKAATDCYEEAVRLGVPLPPM